MKNEIEIKILSSEGTEEEREIYKDIMRKSLSQLTPEQRALLIRLGLNPKIFNVEIDA